MVLVETMHSSPSVYSYYFSGGIDLGGENYFLGEFYWGVIFFGANCPGEVCSRAIMLGDNNPQGQLSWNDLK